MGKNDLLRFIVRRLNVKAVAMLISLFLSISGIVMILMGIKDQGMIDLKTPFISGQAKSGFVGILLIFFSVVTAIGCLSRKKSTHKITIQQGDKKIDWEGSVSTIEELDFVERLVEKKVMGTDVVSSEPVT